MLLVASSRGSVEIDRDLCRLEIDLDLSRKHVGPLALARLYGESLIWYKPIGPTARKSVQGRLLYHL